MTQQLVLFDVDGTLVLTGGAGKRGMTRAFEALFGVPDAFTAISLAGRTDTSILADALEKHGVPSTSSDVAAFRSRYLDYLREEVAQATGGKRVLPGILPLLETLDSSRRSFLGLLTGNYTEAAEVKLAHFDLWRYFRCGAFGEDAHHRNHLVPIALDRARACGLSPGIDAGRVVIVGDTPGDVAWIPADIHQGASGHQQQCITGVGDVVVHRPDRAQRESHFAAVDAAGSGAGDEQSVRGVITDRDDREPDVNELQDSEEHRRVRRVWRPSAR